MMYPFLTLNDNTEIVHSEMLSDGRVKVYIEKPDERDCFHSAVCWLPRYQWEDVSGFSQAEIEYYQEIIQSTAHLIVQRGGQMSVETYCNKLKISCYSYQNKLIAKELNL